jgi:two-component system LytT family response regulator
MKGCGRGRHTVTEIPQTLKKTEEQIDDHHFLRVHRSYLANLTYVEDIKGQYDHLKMHEGFVVSVSRRNRPALNQRLKALVSSV